MQDVAIVGAGELGGSLAHLLARRDVVRSIRLIDAAASVAAGKALDILQASPIEQFATTIAGTTDISYAAGASIVVIADRAGNPEWQGDEALLMLKQLSQLASRAIVLCAGALQRELIERGIRDLRYSPRRLFGSAPEALSAALRSMIALETNGSVHDIAATVLGVPPQQAVVAWQSATVGGFCAIDVLPEPLRRRIEARVPLLWPPGPHALASAATEVIAAMVDDAQRTFSCFLAPEDRAARERVGALPARVGPEGIVRRELPALDPRTRVALETALRL